MKKLLVLALCLIVQNMQCMQNVLKKNKFSDEDIAICVKACRTGNVEIIESMLAKGLNPNTRLSAPLVPDGYEDTTFLHWAVCHPVIVQLLLNRKTDVDALDEEHRTPLCQAACNLKTETVQLLLQHGANPNITDLSENNSLHEITRCAGNGFMGINLSLDEKNSRACTIIAMLRAKGTPVFLQNRTLNTPLHYAAESTSPEIVLSLLNPQLTPEQHQEARNQLFTFLCCLQRTQTTLPNEINFKIFSHLPVMCKHAQIEDLVVPQYLSQKKLLVNYLKEVLSEQEDGIFMLTLESPNLAGKTPQQLAIDLQVKTLLDPKTWS